MIRCGMSEVIITPPLGCSMPGYFHDRRSTGILDELYAKAIVWESNTDMAAIIALDCIDLTRPIVEAIRSQVRAGTGISASCVMVSATHTHTGPPVKTTTFLQDDQAYLDWMIDRAAKAAITAYHSRQDAIIGVGLGQEDRIAYNRRFFMQDGTVRTNPGIGNPHVVRPTGPIDPQVIVLRIDDMQRRPIGVITNYATHTDVVGGTEYSGDYPGELSVAIKEALGSQTVSMFLMGASGNINHYNVVSGKASDYAKPSDYYRRMGRILAAEVLRVREAANTDNEQKLFLHTRQATVTIPYRKPSEEDIRAAEHTLRTEAPEHVECAFAAELLRANERQEPSVDVEIQAILLGDLAIIGLPGELFVEFGLELKEKSPFPITLVSELSNGSVSAYLCTKESYAQGGYEPRITDNNRLAIDAGELLTEHTLKLLNR
jgi:hypothetical protein